MIPPVMKIRGWVAIEDWMKADKIQWMMYIQNADVKEGRIVGTLEINKNGVGVFRTRLYLFVVNGANLSARNDGILYFGGTTRPANFRSVKVDVLA